MLGIAIAITSITTIIFSINWHPLEDTEMLDMRLTNRTMVGQTTHQRVHSSRTCWELFLRHQGKLGRHERSISQDGSACRDATS